MTLNNLGNGQWGLHRFEDAVASFEEALAIRRQLAAIHPDVYLPNVAATLNNLGNVQSDLHRSEGAVTSYEEAVAICRQLAAVRPDVYLPHVAMTLNNLGTVQRDLHRFERAVANYEEALAIRRQLAAIHPDVYLPNVATTLNNLGNVQSELHRCEVAMASFEEALAICRRLAAARPGVYLSDVAITLNNLGTVQRDLHQFEGAAASYEEALAAYRQLAAARPDVYLPNVAMTLNNLGIVQSDLHRFQGAVASYEEAREIYEEHKEQLGSAHLMDRIFMYGNYARLVLQDRPEQNWPDYGLARELLREGCDLAESFRSMFSDPRERIRVQHEEYALYALRVQVSLKCGELFHDSTAYEEALEAAEASRSRSLLDALAQQILPEGVPFDLQQNFLKLQRNLRRAQRRLHQEWEVLELLAEIGVQRDIQVGTGGDIANRAGDDLLAKPEMPPFAGQVGAVGISHTAQSTPLHPGCISLDPHPGCREGPAAADRPDRELYPAVRP